MSNTITLTISQLENLLDRQKEAVYDRLMNDTGVYEKDESEIGPTRGGLFFPFQKEAFKNHVDAAKYPHDFNVLKKYIK